jgi:cyanophycinase
MIKPTTRIGPLILVFLLLAALTSSIPFSAQTTPTQKGWLIIHGGGIMEPEVRDRFVALVGGPDANIVMIPTALSDAEIPHRSDQIATFLGVRNYTELHTRDRNKANSEAFVEPLRHAAGVWIDGGRQWRLVDAYAGTAVERELKALLARGGVVFGSSAGASIQASFLVRGAPATPGNPDGDNTILVAPGYETGFGLLPNSAIDQHVEERARETDLDAVIAAHPELLGIGLDQSAAIIVHGDSFFVVGGQVAIHDGKQHIGGAFYYLLSSGQAFNLKNRAVEQQENLPLTLTPVTAARTPKPSSFASTTTGRGVLESVATSESERITYQCDVTLYSVGNNIYPGRPDGPHQIKIQAREIDTDKLSEHTCAY